MYVIFIRIDSNIFETKAFLCKPNKFVFCVYLIAKDRVCIIVFLRFIVFVSCIKLFSCFYRVSCLLT